MHLSGLLSWIEQSPGYRQLEEALASRQADLPFSALNLMESARPYFLAALVRSLSFPILVLTPRRGRAQEVAEQIKCFSDSPERVEIFLDAEPLPFERAPWDVATIESRLRILTRLAETEDEKVGRSLVVVATASSLARKTIPKTRYLASCQKLRSGQRIRRESLLATWQSLGYEPESLVEEPGQFAVRGGILDIYPFGWPQPLRLELSGEEIASLRAFDPATQRSLPQIEQVTIGPAREALSTKVRKRDWLDLGLEGLNSSAREEFMADLEALASGRLIPTLELYLPLLYHPPGSLLDYFPAGGVVFIDDPLGFRQSLGDLETAVVKEREVLHRRGEMPSWLPSPYFTAGEIERKLRGHHQLQLGTFSQDPISAAFHPAPAYAGRIEEMIKSTLQMVENKKKVVVVSRQAPRLAELYGQGGVHPLAEDEVHRAPTSGLVLVSGGLTRGFGLTTPQGEYLLLADGDLFGWAKMEPRRSPTPRPKAREAFFGDVNPGDCVVHVEHGIGIFSGLANFRENGVEREFLKVDYAQGDTLYIPTYHADRLSRYVGSGGAPPRIDRLGTADWERVLAGAKRGVEEIAQELLELYSAREVAAGFPFPADTPWQQELEASFSYLETEDQVRALQEVKADMEKPRPMDRLICGDVGYGKTEVALRAAFKAVMAGKQVAVLVPTTVLAQQHYLTFQKRLIPFPVEVEMLSRFRSDHEQTRILRELAGGRIDIVIGTHRLLQKDVEFKDLGLLIIDEEQRFGVKDKEKLKTIRRAVDVLSLTATPIPRTLHLSLAGARDMSAIETPPQERLPVVTQVAAYDETLIRRTVIKELDRGGQVYLVHNRVRGIDYLASRLKRLVPEARIVVAHGQMEEKDLAQAMLEFADGLHDILVSTSIIENGIDIPNVNTLIVNRADRFGLAELYQLRGRVGRGAVQAYAYFLYDVGRLSEEAREKLKTIQEAGELGSGFRIAMRDLEIRGAGEILGERQHGHIATVGFDMYTKLLAGAVEELKSGKKPEKELAPVFSLPEVRGPSIDLPLSAHLPEDYVADSALRLSLYRRLAGLNSLNEIKAVAMELADRFGPLPEPAQNLLHVLQLKSLAMMAGIDSLAQDGDRILIRLKESRGRPYWFLPPPARGQGTLVWIPYSPFNEEWRGVLEKTLQALVEGSAE